MSATARETCGRKRRYSLKASAENEAARLHRVNGWRVVAYHCKVCDGFHVGHRQVRKPRRVR